MLVRFAGRVLIVAGTLWFGFMLIGFVALFSWNAFMMDGANLGEGLLVFKQLADPSDLSSALNLGIRFVAGTLAVYLAARLGNGAQPEFGQSTSARPGLVDHAHVNPSPSSDSPTTRPTTARTNLAK